MMQLANHTITLQEHLLEALIGLARAISGNEDLVTDHTDRLLVESLTFLHPQHADDSCNLSQLLSAVAEEKKRIVPDCAVCCNPCGRTENYDMTFLHTAPEAVRTLKYQVLADIQEMAFRICQDELPNSSSQSTHDLAAFLYKVLFALGIDYWTTEKWSAYALDVGKRKVTY